ncbi:MAG: ABC transporter permease [Chloracidobacterium sp.]|nr:ABC transporter permease [Chloracidobacterium sp.]
MLNWLAVFLHDLRFGVRHLAKSPGLTSIAVLSLALGIMATTAIYSVIHAVVLDPFPYKDIDNLMSVKVWDPGQRGYRLGYSTDQFLEIAERNAIFEGVIASTISDVLWTDSGEPQRLRGNYGTFNTFQVMGVPPQIGRVTMPDDARPEAAPVVVLGYRFWQRQFGGDPNVIGRQLRLNDNVRTVIGVMPKRFMWRGADVYLPITFERGRVVEGVRGVHLLGRLKPGVTEAHAEADLRPIIEDLKKIEPAQFPDNWRVGLLSFKETFPSSIRENLWILFGAVGLLLLIACANVSNLLLSKAGARQKEMAVRAALGASRSRLIRQLLTESLLIAITGGALGVALAFGCLRAILAIVPPDTIPDESEIALNTPVLIFTVLVSAMTSILFGLAPALHTSAGDLANPLREAGRGLQGGARQAFLRKALVVAEVTLSLMLLVGAGLMMRTFMAVQDVELGFRTDRLLTMRVPLPEQRYPDRERRVAFFEELLRRVSAIPGVRAVGLNTGMHPFGNYNAPVEVVGGAQQDSRPVVIHQVNADYTKALGIALVVGRLFQENEVSGGRQLALVNQSFVRGRLEGREALGRVVRIPHLKQPPFGATDDSFQIVGVVKDTLNRGLTDQITPEIYLPFTLTGRADRLVALTQADPAGITKSVMSQVYSIDRDQPVTDVKTIDRVLQEGVYAGPRFNLALFAVFATLGLTLAVIGVYGVMSSSVAQQNREIGVRIALGASPGNISRMVVKRGAWLLLIGVAVGLAGSFLTARLLSQQIWKVSPFDPLTFVAVSLILLLAGLQACFWPARRAARIDPIEALRQE